jgi:hypothetical protein
MRKKPQLQGNEELERVRSQFPDIALSSPLAIITVPKCGTMLLRNIMYMFWPINLWHEPFVENWTLREAFARSRNENILCTGHLDFLPETCKFSRGFKRLVLVRDPAAYAMSYARFLLSAEYQSLSKLGQTIRDDEFTLEDTIRFAILGISHENGMIPGVLQQFTSRLAWANGGSLLVRYEELQYAAADPSDPKRRAYFENLLRYLEIAAPPDWLERVNAGADVSLSTTARENLTFVGPPAARDYLEAEELRLLESVAPGLRRTLGYI